MKFGILLPPAGPQSGRFSIIDIALTAENLGFDSVWMEDTLPTSSTGRAGSEKFVDCITTLAYLASSTRRTELGITGLRLGWRDPVEIARQIATLEVLSGGRISVTANLNEKGFSPRCHDQDKQEPLEARLEAFQVLRTLWQGGSIISFSGKYYRFERLSFSPTTIQAGGPPLWIMGNDLASLQMAALYADGWQSGSLTPVQLDEYMRLAEPVLGKRPFTVALRLTLTFQSVLDSMVDLQGPPGKIIQRIKEYQTAGLNHILLNFWAGTPVERERAMKTFSREVLPAFSTFPELK